MESTLHELVVNLTTLVEDIPSQKPTPTLTWVNVAIASSFILVNGKQNNTNKKKPPLQRTIS